MICPPLAASGLGTDLGPVIAAALVLLTVGALLLVTARSHRRTAAMAVVVLLIGSALVVPSAAPARAAAADCVTFAGTLTVTQTSTMTGLAPGVAPAAITGQVVNNGPDSTVVAAVQVTIASVTAGGRAGTCDASDFVLLDTRMVVGRALAAGEAAPFAGAAIGFRDKPVNQDACQNATVHLLYTVEPGLPPAS